MRLNVFKYIFGPAMWILHWYNPKFNSIIPASLTIYSGTLCAL